MQFCRWNVRTECYELSFYVEKKAHKSEVLFNDTLCHYFLLAILVFWWKQICYNVVTWREVTSPLRTGYAHYTDIVMWYLWEPALILWAGNVCTNYNHLTALHVGCDLLPNILCGGGGERRARCCRKLLPSGFNETCIKHLTSIGIHLYF